MAKLCGAKSRPISRCRSRTSMASSRRPSNFMFGHIFRFRRSTKRTGDCASKAKSRNLSRLNFDELLKFESRTIAGNAGVRGQQPEFSRAESERGPLGARRGRQRGMDRRSVVDPARSRRCESGCDRSYFGRRRSGPLDDPKAAAGRIADSRAAFHYTKAREDVLLAYKMNGGDLPPEHGFPVRAIVPGWYAMASIKWLQRIIVTNKPFNGYYQTLDYAFWKDEGSCGIGPHFRNADQSRDRAGRCRATPFPQIRMCEFGARPGPAKVKYRELKSAPMAVSSWCSDAAIGDQPNQTPGGFGNSIGERPAQPGKQILVARATDSSGRTAARQTRSRSRHLHDQSSAADRG